MLWNAFWLALREIRRNVLRSFLTVLGIVIGVAAVIVMVTIGSGATVQVTEQIASLGSNLLMVTPGQRMGMGQRSTASAFDTDDVEAIYQGISGIAAVAPVSRAASTVVAGNANWTTTLVGTDNAYFQAGNWTLAEGRQFAEAELRIGAAQCILGNTVKKELFGSQSPLGASIRMKTMSCTVVGLLAAKGQSAMGSDQDDIIVMPLRTLQRRIAGNRDINMIQVSVRDGVSTDKVQADLTHLLRERRHIAATEDDDFSVMDMKEISSMLAGTTQILTMLLSAVAAVSLLVGGIGIMNIMLVSVTERTREIGIRLAIGALESEVLLQFLVEALVLSSLGGIMGIILALLAAVAIASAMNVPFVFEGGTIALAFGFSALVGIVFGYFPARKAARLNPIDALRHE